MLIVRSPYRVSLLGGGTDYENWTAKHIGEVISTSINKYCYILVKELPNYFDHKYRVVYREIESTKTIDEIKHPSVRECLRYSGIKCGVEIHHAGDLPARSGMGSSSAFTVGLLNALYCLQGRYTTKEELAKQAIHIEQNILKENVGSQDQIASAYGGFNRILFSNGDFTVYPIITGKERIRELNNHLMLFFTGINRTASDIASTFVTSLDNKRRQQRISKELANEGIKIICSNTDIRQIGELLHEYWMIKKSLSDQVSNSFIDNLYEKALKEGAIGGKITGAGGGGCMLLFVEPHLQDKIKAIFKDLVYIPFEFENMGSHVWRH
jgi:D-glycero-alpha-D-manno-heptose-7-phosphate kinase